VACLDRFEKGAVLVGFTTPDQVRRNLAAVRRPPTAEALRAVRAIMAETQRTLDSMGEVFADEQPGKGPSS
jgi:aryl-alcohol dehydrogenase-like predicted oxidoreductase